MTTTTTDQQAAAENHENHSGAIVHHCNTIFYVDAGGNILPPNPPFVLPGYPGYWCQVSAGESGYSGPIYIVYDGNQIQIAPGTGPGAGWLLPPGIYPATVTTNKVGTTNGELDVGSGQKPPGRGHGHGHGHG
jgi:hypothetical protein